MMTFLRRSVAVLMVCLLLAACSLCLTGCRKRGPVGRDGDVLGLLNTGKARNDLQGVVAGIDEFAVIAARWNGERVFVVWFDDPSYGVDTSGFEMTSHRGDGGIVTVMCPELGLQSTPVKRGGKAYTTVAIDGKAYNLADGAFFLISAHAGPLKVKQRQYDLNKIPRGNDALRNMALKDPEITTFYAPGGPPGAPSTKGAGDAQATQPAKEIELDCGQGVTMKLVYIPPGKFIMGAPENELPRGIDEIQHQVTLTRPFHMGATEVTQTQWQLVMGTSIAPAAGQMPRVVAPVRRRSQPSDVLRIVA